MKTNQSTFETGWSQNGGEEINRVAVGGLLARGKEVVGSNPPNPDIPAGYTGCYRRLLAWRNRVEAARHSNVLLARQPVEGFSMNMADAATDEFDHIMALSGLSTEQEVLYEIDAALQRIKNGTYGICEVTGKRIPKARLAAVPWTRFTRPIEEQLERRRQTGLPHLGDLRSVKGSVSGNLEASRNREGGPTLPAGHEDFIASPFLTPTCLPKRKKTGGSIAPGRNKPVRQQKKSSRGGNQPSRATGKERKGQGYVSMRSMRKSIR